MNLLKKFSFSLFTLLSASSLLAILLWSQNNESNNLERVISKNKKLSLKAQLSLSKKILGDLAKEVISLEKTLSSNNSNLEQRKKSKENYQKSKESAQKRLESTTLKIQESVKKIERLKKPGKMNEERSRLILKGHEKLKELKDRLSSLITSKNTEELQKIFSGDLGKSGKDILKIAKNFKSFLDSKRTVLTKIRKQEQFKTSQEKLKKEVESSIKKAEEKIKELEDMISSLEKTAKEKKEELDRLNKEKSREETEKNNLEQQLTQV